MWHKKSTEHVRFPTDKIKKSRKGVLWWRTRDSVSHVSQWSDSLQNQGVSQISLLFLILTVHTFNSRDTMILFYPNEESC